MYLLLYFRKNDLFGIGVVDETVFSRGFLQGGMGQEIRISMLPSKKDRRRCKVIDKGLAVIMDCFWTITTNLVSAEARMTGY